MSFALVLEELQVTRDEYIFLFPSLVTRLTLIHKRDPRNFWINDFAKEMPGLWKENTGAKYILDSYATTTHVISYIIKLDKTMTTDFKKIKEEFVKKMKGK